MELKEKIHIGTSGYSFQDWYGHFYPPETPKGKMLDHYQNFFDTVEINSTYYRISNRFIMKKISDKTPKDFHFQVKIPSHFTHQRKFDQKIIDEFNDSLVPMKEDRKLKGLLAQFPYSFKFNHQNLDYLGEIKNIFNDDPLFIEFRHYSWKNKTVMDYLTQKNLGYVTVDVPPLRGLFPFYAYAANNIAYVRLHGRNSEKWWNSPNQERYDYDYSEEEIQDLFQNLESLFHSSEIIYFFFNNCHAGQAVKNALLLKKLIELF